MSFPYSSQSHTTVNSTTADFSYSDVPLLADVPHKDQLKVYENGQLRTFSNTGNDNYTLVVASELVRFNTNRSQGVTIKIARSTDIENKEVTFTNSSVLTAQDLNKNSDQLLFLAQELYDKAQDISLTAAGGIPPNSIGEDKLNQSSGTEAVVTTAIRDDAVTTAKIDDEAVTAAKLGASAVETAKIQDGAVTPVKLSTGAPSWDGSGNLTVTGNIIAGSDFYPGFSSLHLTTQHTYAITDNRATSPALAALNTSITVKRTTSKILVRFNVSYDVNHDGVFILERGDGSNPSTWTELGNPAIAGQRRVGIKPFNYDNDIDSTMTTTVIDFIDTVPSAGVYTYRLRAHSRYGSTTLGLNRTYSDTDLVGYERASSTVILQEVFTQ